MFVTLFINKHIRFKGSTLRSGDLRHDTNSSVWVCVHAVKYVTHAPPMCGVDASSTFSSAALRVQRNVFLYRRRRQSNTTQAPTPSPSCDFLLHCNLIHSTWWLLPASSLLCAPSQMMCCLCSGFLSSSPGSGCEALWSSMLHLGAEAGVLVLTRKKKLSSMSLVDRHNMKVHMTGSGNVWSGAALSTSPLWIFKEMCRPDNV